MTILEQEDLVKSLSPFLDALFRSAVDHEDGGQFSSYDLERQRRILRVTFDRFWEISKIEIEGRMDTKNVSDQVVLNTLLQFCHDYIERKLEEFNAEET